jgi:hypothetical protein
MRRKSTEMESITVLVEKTRKKDLLFLLGMLDFVSVESKKERITRYVTEAPTNMTLNDDEVMYEVKAVRNKKRNKIAR